MKLLAAAPSQPTSIAGATQAGVAARARCREFFLKALQNSPKIESPACQIPFGKRNYFDAGMVRRRIRADGQPAQGLGCIAQSQRLGDNPKSCLRVG